jgi:hypothetical protein
MKENLLDILRISTYYPRKLIDFCLYNIYLKHRNNWDQIKQFSNRPIMIVGNGPSLNSTPLHLLDKSYVSIGMNKINLLFNKSTWRPDIITCVNGLVIKQNKDFFNQTNIILIVPVKAIYLGVKPRKNILFVKLKDQEKVETDIERHLTTGCTVTFSALQVAAYLNPTRVGIVGVDHSFKVTKGTNYDIRKFEGDDINHFSKDYFKNQYWGVPDLEGSEKLYELAKAHFTSKNISITDYTINGKLQIFVKGEFESLCVSNTNFSNNLD